MLIVLERQRYRVNCWSNNGYKYEPGASGSPWSVRKYN